MDDIDHLLAPHKFPLAAVHGLELRDGEGRITRTEVDPEVLTRIERVLGRFVEENAETLLEHKGVSLALHYRKRPELEEAAIQLVEKTLSEVGANVKVLRGNKVVEIRPDGEDKGSAIVRFMKEAPFSGRTPVFIGDDATDEDGFRTVNALGGVSVKVNSGETAAAARLPDVNAVLNWLEQRVSS
jgi:trehalose 6-phosphate phosphatase